MISAITLVLTMFLLPAGNWRLKLAREEIGVRPGLSAVKPRVFNEDIPSLLLYIHDQKAGGIDWEGVILARLDKEKSQHRIILSKSCQIEILPGGISYNFTLWMEQITSSVKKILPNTGRANLARYLFRSISLSLSQW